MCFFESVFCFTRAAGAPRPLRALPARCGRSAPAAGRSAPTRTLPRYARCGPFGPAAGASQSGKQHQSVITDYPIGN